jgi:hypothetical protein
VGGRALHSEAEVDMVGKAPAGYSSLSGAEWEFVPEPVAVL